MVDAIETRRVFESITGPVLAWELHRDRHENLWVGTAGGLVIIPASAQQARALERVGRPISPFRHFTVDSESQERHRAADSSYQWLLVDQRQGLPHSQVRSFLWDGACLWVGTDKGLGVWNGAAWRIITTREGLAHDEVHALMMDSQGRLWVGTRHGVSVWDGRRWRLFTTDEGLGGNYVTALLEDSRAWVWAGVLGPPFGGVSVFRSGTWSDWREGVGPSHYAVQALLEDSLGRIWVGQDERGISIFDGKTWQYIERLGTGIFCLLEDSNRHVWVATEGWGEEGRVTVFDLDLSRVRDEEKARIHRWFTANSMLEDPLGRIWIGTDEGLSMFDGSMWHVYTPANVLTSHSVIDLAQDLNGRVWMATYQGVVVYDDGKWRTFTAEDGLSGSLVYCILVDSQGRVWAGGDGGVYVWTGGRWTVHPLPAIKDSHGRVWANTGRGGIVLSLLEDERGRIWAGTVQGLGVPTAMGWRVILRSDFPPESAADNSVTMNGLVESHDGRIWIGTESGLTFYEDGKWRPFDAPEGSIPGPVLSVFEDSRGSLWVGGGWGVTEIGRDDWQVHRFLAEPGFEHRPVAAQTSRAEVEVRDIIEDPAGRVWVATVGGGVAVWDGSEWRRFGLGCGLSSLRVYALMIDSCGRLWVGTHTGGVCTSTHAVNEL